MMIEVRGLTRFYGTFSALEDVSFEVSEGEIIGLLGLNGAGKSTTLKILAGLIPPSSGTVRVDGIDLVAEPERLRARIGYLPEDPPLYTDMTVEAFVRYIGRLKGVDAASVEARLPEVLETAQLTDRAGQIIGTLSHGYRKRVGIAQAIIHDPKLVILDEPISGLDPKQIVGMREVIRKLAKGRAVLVSSHILSEVEATCDRLLVLKDGRLVRQGTEAELTADLRRTRLRLTARDPEGKLAAFVRGVDGVSDVTEKGAAGGLSTVVVVMETDVREALAAAVVGAGFGLRALDEAEAALEGVFMGLTGGDA